jgi:hypothetical protein
MSEAMTENLVRHQEKVERIQANPDLSDEAKQRLVAEATERAAEESARLKAEEREAIAKALESAERLVLSISYPERASAHERAMIAMSYRNARRQAESVAESGEGLSDLLEQAENTGDAQLAEAVYHVATLRGSRAVADAYLESRPRERRRWEAYVEARREAEGVDSLLHRGLAHSLSRTQLGG